MMAEVTTFHFNLHEVAPYINWLYFFHAWGFPTHLGSIAKVHECNVCRQNWLYGFKTNKDRTRAREAMQLYDEALLLLNRLDVTYHTHARVLICKAHSEGDDIMLEDYQQEKNDSIRGWQEKKFRLPLLRQQTPGRDGMCWCLSDFVHPMKDKIGLFVCTTDRAMEVLMAHDDYQHLLHQTLADRLAEATAEKVHEMVRRELWGYTPNEHFTVEELFAEHYQGRRPAVGYPSLPDQSINLLLDEVLDFSSIGISLTENGAMLPHASTSGIMLSHPATQNFSVGTVGEDQMKDYAHRRGMSVEEIKKFLKSYSTIPNK